MFGIPVLFWHTSDSPRFAKRASSCKALDVWSPSSKPPCMGEKSEAPKGTSQIHSECWSSKHT